MADTSTPNDEEALPVAQLISGNDANRLTTKSFSFGDFEQTEQKMRSDLKDQAMNQLKREVAPQVRQQAELIKKEAFEKAQKQGYENGYEEGFEVGKDEASLQATIEAEEALQPKVAAIESVLQAMNAPYKSLESSVYQSLVALSIGLAEKIIEKEISTDPERILKVIQDAIALLPDETVAIKLEVHPDDLQTVETYRENFSKDWQVQVSETLSVGDCRVRHDASLVENIWRQSFAQLAESVLDEAESAPNSENAETEIPSQTGHE